MPMVSEEPFRHSLFPVPRFERHKLVICSVTVDIILLIMCGGSLDACVIRKKIAWRRLKAKNMQTAMSLSQDDHLSSTIGSNNERSHHHENLPASRCNSNHSLTIASSNRVTLVTSGFVRTSLISPSGMLKDKNTFVKLLRSTLSVALLRASFHLRRPTSRCELSAFHYVLKRA